MPATVEQCFLKVHALCAADWYVHLIFRPCMPSRPEPALAQLNGGYMCLSVTCMNRKRWTSRDCAICMIWYYLAFWLD